MKRKDFLRKMKDRRRGGTLEKRQPEKRRKVDWRTLRVDLPGPEEKLPAAEPMPFGVLHRMPKGIRLEASSICWVRGYRRYEVEGVPRAEFQYRPVEIDSEAPPGSVSLKPGESWEPEN
tara:strand:- start:1066 stop:1422 length:357 start_codon:yes stop_codon:yes gene_type:complete